MIRAGRYLEGVVLIFWTAWFGVVAASNFCDLAKTSGALPAGWKFASGNLAAMIQATEIYQVPTRVNQFLLLGVVGWEGFVAWLMARALRKSPGKAALAARVDLAFAAAVGLFAAFCLADELLIAFPTGIEATHLQITIALLASFAILRLAKPE